MSLFTPNTERIYNLNDKGKYLLAWRLMLLFGVSFTLLMLISFSASMKEGEVYLICVIISIMSLAYLKKTQKFKFIYFFLAFSGSLLAFFTLNFFNEILHIGDFLWLVLIIMFTFFGLGTRSGFVVSSFVLLNVVYYFSYSVENNVKQLVDMSLSVRIGLIIEISTAILSIMYLIYQFVLIHDNSNKELSLANKSLRDQNELIKQSNIEKTALIQEVHHRVKNNLQIIISLLRLQSNEIESLEAKTSLSEAINRIMVMSLIHQKLYGKKSLSKIDLKEYLNDLIIDINKVYSDNIVNIKIVTNYNVGLKTIVPLGLLFNELVTNSFKHGFSNVEDGEISILIKQKLGKDFEVYYSDNGNWIEPKGNSFGLELLEIMTNQLEGHFEKIKETNKTTFIFFIKDIDEDDERSIKEQLNINDNLSL